MAEIINLKSKTRYAPSSEKEMQIKDTRISLQNVIDRKPTSCIILSWNGCVDEGMNIDYSELGRLSECLAALEIAKSKLLKENYN